MTKPKVPTLPDGNPADSQPKARNTVTVFCKFPAGLMLQLQAKRAVTVQTMSGQKDTHQFHRVGDEVFIRGPAEPAGQAPKGYTRPQIESGYAMTHNVDAEFMRKWMEQNAESPLVTSKTILVAKPGDSGEAREHEKMLTGFEPLNPEGDARQPKPLSAGVAPVVKADERAAA